MSAAFPFTWSDPLSPESWYGWGFEFSASGQALVALPPTITFKGDLGAADPYEYDHAPYSDAWFRLGDGVARDRPLLLLGGSHTYRNVAEALAHTAQIEQALAIADQVSWRGQPLAQLNPAFTNTALFSTGDRFVDTTFSLTLNTLTRVTRATLAEVQV